ncbi:MAG TPA: type II toxin-antitoxin system RelE/ParE family toxin [Verrucomicrobiae bacterium]|nr:type II toxin-antitoxin system RelE/ParE family toxin [Verrucomicrobiae bacterium]
MGCKIIFSPQAIADLEEVVRHIAKDDPASATRIGNALIDRVEILENFPLLGAPYPKRPGVHKLVSRPYLIFYRPRLGENTVDILRYWHGAQRDPDLRSLD